MWASASAAIAILVIHILFPRLDKVAKVKRNGRKYQLLLVQGIEEDNINIFHVVKVIDREEVDPMTLRTQLAWLRSTIAMDG